MSFSTRVEALGPDFNPEKIIGTDGQVIEPGGKGPFPSVVTSISLVGTETEVKGATFVLMYEDFGPPGIHDLIK